MPKKAAKKVVRKRATKAKKSAPKRIQHVPASPRMRRQVDGVWHWMSWNLVQLDPLSKSELAAEGLENE
jgi:hypothetical protein